MKKGEVWLVEFPSTNGREQAGTRPVVVLAETGIDIVIVVPFTSNLQALRFPHTIEVRPLGTEFLQEPQQKKWDMSLTQLITIGIGFALQQRVLAVMSQELMMLYPLLI